MFSIKDRIVGSVLHRQRRPVFVRRPVEIQRLDARPNCTRQTYRTTNPRLRRGYEALYPSLNPLDRVLDKSDLVHQADEVTRGVAYAYTILDPHTGDIIGCTYIDPDESQPDRSTEVETTPTTRCATVTCWVRASHAELDEPVVAALTHWLASSWNLAQFTFPGRD